MRQASVVRETGGWKESLWEVSKPGPSSVLGVFFFPLRSLLQSLVLCTSSSELTAVSTAVFNNRSRSRRLDTLAGKSVWASLLRWSCQRSWSRSVSSAHTSFVSLVRSACFDASLRALRQKFHTSGTPLNTINHSFPRRRLYFIVRVIYGCRKYNYGVTNRTSLNGNYMYRFSPREFFKIVEITRADRGKTGRWRETIVSEHFWIGVLKLSRKSWSIDDPFLVIGTFFGE